MLQLNFTIVLFFNSTVTRGSRPVAPVRGWRRQAGCACCTAACPGGLLAALSYTEILFPIVVWLDF